MEDDVVTIKLPARTIEVGDLVRFEDHPRIMEVVETETCGMYFNATTGTSGWLIHATQIGASHGGIVADEKSFTIVSGQRSN
jgi:hypothetical protein